MVIKFEKGVEVVAYLSWVGFEPTKFSLWAKGFTVKLSAYRLRTSSIDRNK